jgi:hypothetical protein
MLLCAAYSLHHEPSTTAARCLECFRTCNDAVSPPLPHLQHFKCDRTIGTYITDVGCSVCLADCETVTTLNRRPTGPHDTKPCESCRAPFMGRVLFHPPKFGFTNSARSAMLVVACTMVILLPSMHRQAELLRSSAMGRERRRLSVRVRGCRGHAWWSQACDGCSVWCC